MNKLGVCYITKNPNKLLFESINSVYPWVDEIIVIDDFSTNGIINGVVNKFGCKLYLHKYLGEGKQRNFGLSRLTSKWVLILDADEIVTPKLAKEIFKTIQISKASGFYIPMQNYFVNKPIYHGGEDYSKLILLKRSQACATNNEIHSKYFVHDNKLDKLKNKINHFSYPSLLTMFIKFTSYAFRQAKEKVTLGEKTSIKKILLYAPHMFWARFISSRGYIDGFFRIPLDIGHAYMEFLTYLLMLFVKPRKEAQLPIKRDYSDIVKSYKEYVRLQTVDYCTFESKNIRSSKGQERYIIKHFMNLNRNLRIADIACGDGEGLKIFSKLGFKKVIGIDFNEKKLSIARSQGFKVIKSDIHKLSNTKNDYFDVIYSSHTLEHSYSPAMVIHQFSKKLKKDGRLFIVCPYPDTNYLNELAHGAKYMLGLNIPDKGKTIINKFRDYGFSLVKLEFDKYREPEIWLEFRKTP